MLTIGIRAFCPTRPSRGALTPPSSRRSLKRVFGPERADAAGEVQLHHPVRLARARRARAVLPATPTSSASPSCRKRLKLHKNNVFRLLATLESRGYIEQNKATENYRLGIRCLQLGQSYVQQHGPAAPGAPDHGRRWCRQARETRVRRGAAREAAWCRSRRSRPSGRCASSSRIGEALPLHCTAAGKVAARLRVRRRAAQALLPEALPKLHREDHHRAPGAASSSCKSVAENGYAVDLGEHIEDVRSVAVPIRDYTRNVVGSLAVVGPGVPLPGRAHREGGRAADREGRAASCRAGSASTPGQREAS